MWKKGKYYFYAVVTGKKGRVETTKKVHFTINGKIDAEEEEEEDNKKGDNNRKKKDDNKFEKSLKGYLNPWSESLLIDLKLCILY